MDGEYIIAGGKSKYICIYNVKEEMLVRRFEISQNKSFDGIDVGFKNFFLQFFLLNWLMIGFLGISGQT